MRPFTPAQAAAINARVARWAHLARFEFDGQPLYLNDQDLGFSVFWEDVAGSGVVNEFEGVGALGGISGVEDSVELKAHSVTFQLSGVRDEDVALVLNEHVQGRRVMVWRALFDADHRVIDDPWLRFVGRMNTLALRRTEDGVQTAELTVANRMADWGRAAPVRFNAGNHQARHPGDRFFEFAEETAEKQILWGRS
ncbi:MAG: hypothetical protein NXI21_01730 [Alphaproteobacteria bacterium]|nr:hypothetical protein [Alphaproteobacteria bacterium]